MNTKILSPVVEIMQRDGATDDHIADILADITTAATVLLYSKAMDALSDEDIKAIEDCPSDDEANKLIARLYADNLGTSPEEMMNIFLKDYSASFIREYNKTNPS